jgi:hypothetical protein
MIISKLRIDTNKSCCKLAVQVFFEHLFLTATCLCLNFTKFVLKTHKQANIFMFSILAIAINVKLW